MPFLGSCQYTKITDLAAKQKMSLDLHIHTQAAIAKTVMLCSFSLPYSQFAKTKIESQIFYHLNMDQLPLS